MQNEILIQCLYKFTSHCSLCNLFYLFVFLVGEGREWIMLICEEREICQETIKINIKKIDTLMK